MLVHTGLYNLDADSKHPCDYLSVDQTQLPILYSVFSFTYFAFLTLWIIICYSNKLSLHQIHLLKTKLWLDHKKELRNVVKVFPYCLGRSSSGFREETFKPNEGDKGAEARPQYLR
ncbi:hypothetical protein JHK82_042390 [Glycine max]|nr:hypothetical protein JHK82_042390 [Glycine max]KAG5116547.1 hypothetical protein JHK84_042660 [Glycine max]